MAHWIMLLAGALALGACIVGAMVAPRHLTLFALAGAAAGLGTSAVAFRTIAATYATTEAATFAAGFLVAGTASGYAIAAALLPALARRLPRLSLAAQAGDGIAVVLLSTSEPERYSPRAVATRSADLASGGAVELPSGATPLVFLSEKARYRHAGGICPGAAEARRIAAGTADALAAQGVECAVRVAWTYGRQSLVREVEAAVAEGAGTVAVTVLGSADSEPVDRAKEVLENAHPRGAGVHIAFSPPLWHQPRIAERLAERIVAATRGAALADVGVVLVSGGVPPDWERSHPAACEEENYLNQRTRMLLADHGIDEGGIRIAWLDWQLPDVTEAVRHVAAVGRTRIVVAPSTIAVTTLATLIDLRHAVEYARLPRNVHVVTLPAWGVDDVLLGGVVGCTRTALETRG